MRNEKLKYAKELIKDEALREAVMTQIIAQSLLESKSRHSVKDLLDAVLELAKSTETIFERLKSDDVVSEDKTIALTLLSL